MRLPYTQIASEVIEHGAADVAVMLGSTRTQILGGLVLLFDWAIKRAKEDRPPSLSDTIRGPGAAKLIARAADWAGSPDEFISACEHLPEPPVERLDDGAIRICGLKRYDSAWLKKQPKDLAAAWRKFLDGAGPAPNLTPIRSESPANPPPIPREPVANPPGSGGDSARKTQTQTQTQTHIEATTPPRANANDTLRDAVERMWEQHLGNKPKGISDADLRAAYDKAGGDVRELLRVLANALKSPYPTMARFPDLVRYWDKFAASKGPEPGRKKSQHTRADEGDKVQPGYRPPLDENGDIDFSAGGP